MCYNLNNCHNWACVIVDYQSIAFVTACGRIVHVLQSRLCQKCAFVIIASVIILPVPHSSVPQSSQCHNYACNNHNCTIISLVSQLRLDYQYNNAPQERRPSWNECTVFTRWYDKARAIMQMFITLPDPWRLTIKFTRRSRNKDDKSCYFREYKSIKKYRRECYNMSGISIVH